MSQGFFLTEELTEFVETPQIKELAVSTLVRSRGEFTNGKG